MRADFAYFNGGGNRANNTVGAFPLGVPWVLAQYDVFSSPAS